MTEIVVHVHVHQAAARGSSSTIDMATLAAPQNSQPLEWSQTLCDGERVDYAAAEKAVADLGPGWRISTVEEAFAANDYSKNPVCDAPGVKPGYHWTSTRCPWAPESAVFVVNTDDGSVNVNDRDYKCFVRAVRAVPGQSSGL